MSTLDLERPDVASDPLLKIEAIIATVPREIEAKILPQIDLEDLKNRIKKLVQNGYSGIEPTRSLLVSDYYAYDNPLDLPESFSVDELGVLEHDRENLDQVMAMLGYLVSDGQAKLVRFPEQITIRIRHGIYKEGEAELVTLTIKDKRVEREEKEGQISERREAEVTLRTPFDQAAKFLESLHYNHKRRERFFRQGWLVNASGGGKVKIEFNEEEKDPSLNWIELEGNTKQAVLDCAHELGLRPEDLMDISKNDLQKRRANNK